MFKRLWVIAITFLLLIALPLPAQATATSQALLRVAWDHDPVTVYVSLQKGVDLSYKTQVIAAFNNWRDYLRASSGNPSAFGFSVVGQPLSKKKPADITVTVRKNTGSVLGSAMVSSAGGVIQSVKITLAAYNALGLPLGVEDFNSIARHEIGHALGLGHSNDDGQAPLDLMAPTFDFVGVNYDVMPSPLNVAATLFVYGNDGFAEPNLAAIPPSYPP